MKIKDLMIKSINSLKTDNPKLDVEIMLSNVLEVDRIYLHLNLDKELSKEKVNEFEVLLEQRKQNKPIAYIINNKEFMGLDFYVKEGVLIPRPDTEILVEEVIKLSKNFDYNIIVDVGTGSGAISISLANYIENSKIYSLDISDIALEVAKFNAINNNVQSKIEFIKSDVFSNLDKSVKANIIVSNPPYIRKEVINTLSEDVKNYEPHLALDGGEDGLVFYENITKLCDDNLINGGFLAYEIGYDQGEDVKNIMIKNGFNNVYIIKDIAGLDRVVVGMKL